MTKCIQRAKEVMFWPGMSKEIEHVVQGCDRCQEYRVSNTKEPMLPGPTPDRPWDIVATDLFQWENRNYLLIVDYYSRYFETEKLEDLTSTSVINHTKSIFARHGIPTQLISDNGPQFSAELYKAFTKEWGIKHITSSPHYPQANGLAEKYVQVVKRIMKKAKADNKDPYMAILGYRNTMIDNIASPAQLLMGRKLRTNLPVTAEQLKPAIVNPEQVKIKLKLKQQKQKKHYDRGSKALPNLKIGDHA